MWWAHRGPGYAYVLQEVVWLVTRHRRHRAGTGNGGRQRWSGHRATWGVQLQPARRDAFSQTRYAAQRRSGGVGCGYQGRGVLERGGCPSERVYADGYAGTWRVCTREARFRRVIRNIHSASRFRTSRILSSPYNTACAQREQGEYPATKCLGGRRE